MTNVIKVVRLQLLNRSTYVYMPLLILAGALLLALLVFALIPTSEAKYGFGAAGAPLWSFLVVGVQALTLTFPFSQALSITRRDFHLGTLLTAALTSGMLAAAFAAIGVIERATHGWGMNGYVTLPSLGGDAPGAAFLAYFVIAMLFFVSGYFCAAINKRWGALALIAALVGLTLVLAVVILLVFRAGVAGEVEAWLVAQGALGLALWGLALLAVLGLGSLAVIRRMVP